MLPISNSSLGTHSEPQQLTHTNKHRILFIFPSPIFTMVPLSTDVYHSDWILKNGSLIQDFQSKFISGVLSWRRHCRR